MAKRRTQPRRDAKPDARIAEGGRPTAATREEGCGASHEHGASGPGGAGSPILGDALSTDRAEGAINGQFERRNGRAVETEAGEPTTRVGRDGTLREGAIPGP